MPSFNIMGLLVPKKKTVNVSVIYGHGGHLGHVTQTVVINECTSFQRRRHIKVDFDTQSCFIVSRCLKTRIQYMHLAPGKG